MNLLNNIMLIMIILFLIEGLNKIYINITKPLHYEKENYFLAGLLIISSLFWEGIRYWAFEKSFYKLLFSYLKRIIDVIYIG